MKHLKAVNKYFWKYRYRLSAGILFIIISNYFAILAPQITAYVVDKVQQLLPGAAVRPLARQTDPLVNILTDWIESLQWSFSGIVALCGLSILLLALIRGLFMFFMRQTIIVMSRHIEFDQKNEVYQHYQQLDTQFFKAHAVGDLMSRISEDVSRVRMYTGPAIMYLVNLITVIIFAVYNMLGKNVELTLYTLAPLPVLAIVIYYVNTIIHRKSEKIQALLGDMTSNAQQSYSGIRVIKSFVQEKNMLRFFDKNSEQYRDNAIGLAKVEAFYFPSMMLLIGVSTLLTIMIGGLYYLQGRISDVGVIVEFVLYVNMLTFPVSAIGWVASMVQRAAASQKRLNEFLEQQPDVKDGKGAEPAHAAGAVSCRQVTFTYAHSGIVAIRNFSLDIKPGTKVAIIGKTGSGKSTIAGLLMRMFDADSGEVLLDGVPVSDYHLGSLRSQISYVPQDVFLFSDTVANNIRFGHSMATQEMVEQAAKMAVIDQEIQQFSNGYETLVGERGVTLSGGQKQRISIARALLKPASLVIFDDCLSAVDASTEKQVLHNLSEFLENKTAIVITHRIFALLQFDHIVIMDNGEIIEQGTHQSLMAQEGEYAALYRQQQMQDAVAAPEL
ncbi:MAG TPA: ABC transporter ATP-binding protein [Phnomibacter sp.]|nr:ABC transporter ATP-binding protein [Phnomibacter sp.]